MKEFPKMLYKTHSDHITVDTGKEETAARADGYVDYADLSDGDGVAMANPHAAGEATELVLTPLLDGLNAQIKEQQSTIDELESANHMLVAENEGLRAQVADYETRLQEANQRTANTTQANTDPAGANAGKIGSTTKTNK